MTKSELPFKEKWMLRIAHLMPRWLVYWCGVRLGGHSIDHEVFTDNQINDIGLTRALHNWKYKKNLNED